MDGKLTGRLSQRRQLTGRLSVMPRVGPGAVLIPKTISENGIYRAADDRADGYYEVTVEVPSKTEPLVPYVFDMTGGYVASGTWNLGGDTVNYSDVYEVQAGTVYLLMIGSIVGSRFRSMFSEEDTSVAEKNIIGKAISNVSNPAAYSYVVYKPTADGFITVTKDNAGTAGLKTYLFRLPDLIDE